MLQNINIEEIKQYNASLKEQREKAATLKAQIDYTTNELNKLCQELSAELGKEVTKDNIEQIYNEEVTKINSTLQSGKAVLAKIASGGNTATSTAPVTQAAPTTQNVTAPAGTAPVTPNVVFQQPVSQTTAQQQPPVAPVLPDVSNTVQASGPVFNNASGQGANLTPMFKI